MLEFYHLKIQLGSVRVALFSAATIYGVFQ